MGARKDDQGRVETALRPPGISHEQYSLMMSLNRPAPPRQGEAAAFLAMAVRR